MLKCVCVGRGLKILNRYGEGKANFDLGAGGGTYFDLPDRTNNSDVLVVKFFVLISTLVIIPKQMKSMGLESSS